MIPNDDIFGCFGNTRLENCIACCLPCYTYGKLIHEHNLKDKTHQAECNFCTASLTYCCCYCHPWLPGMYLRILQNEELVTGCLSYTFFPCCSLQQDARRINPKSYSSESE